MIIGISCLRQTKKKRLNKMAVDLDSAGLMLKAGGFTNEILSTVNLRNTGRVMESTLDLWII